MSLINLVIIQPYPDRTYFVGLLAVGFLHALAFDAPHFLSHVRLTPTYEVERCLPRVL